MKTGFIGLGAMGAGMARNLHKAGLLATVWNRTPGTAREFADALQLPLADDPAGLAADVDVVLICVSRDEDVLSVVDAALPGLGEGSVVVDCSTISEETAREAARRVAACGAGFLDAPVSGGKEGADNGQLVFMVGGDENAFRRLAPAFEAMGKAATHMGPVGSGQATKAVNQIMAAGIIQAVTEALAFGQASGLDMKKVIDVVAGGAAGNWLLQKRGPTMVEGQFDPGFKLALHHKDLEICRRMAADLGVALPVVEMTLKHYRRLMDEGYGDEDISALFRAKQTLFREGNLRGL